MDDIVDNFLNSLQSHIPSLEDDLEGEEEIFLEQVETVNFMNMGIDAWNLGQNLKYICPIQSKAHSFG